VNLAALFRFASDVHPAQKALLERIPQARPTGFEPVTFGSVATGNRLRAASQSAEGNAALQLALQRLGASGRTRRSTCAVAVQLVERPVGRVTAPSRRRLVRLGRVHVLLDLDREHLGTRHLAVEELQNPPQAGRYLVRDENQSEALRLKIGGYLSSLTTEPGARHGRASALTPDAEATATSPELPAFRPARAAVGHRDSRAARVLRIVE
jgi:hypothetical protein